MKKPRMMKISEMDADQAAAYKVRVQIAEREGKAKPKRPLAPSAPGEPPRAITRLLKDLLFFGYDTEKRSVVIGPVRANAKGRDVPEVLEYGGTSSTWRRKKIKVQARPYMGPAFEENKPQLPAMWANSIQG